MSRSNPTCELISFGNAPPNRIGKKRRRSLTNTKRLLLWLMKQLIKRLDEASWLSRDNVAREIVAELSQAEIRSLSPTTRDRLQQELMSGYISEADREACDRIIRAGFDDRVRL